jgi:hypothetical protein
MASIGWEKTGRRWRVFWHVTLRDGTLDKGSRSFEDKTQATKFKEHCEKNEKALKQAINGCPALPTYPFILHMGPNQHRRGSYLPKTNQCIFLPGNNMGVGYGFLRE